MATFTNQATLSYNNTTTTSNIVTGELIEVLTANKTAVPITYRIGDTVTFIINLINSGGTALTGTSISSDLGTYTTSALVSVTPLTYVDGSVRYYSNGILQTTPTVTAGPPLVISNITVPANGNATIIYQAVVNNYAPPATNGTITDSSTITNAALFNDVVVAASIIAESSADLSITKSISPEAVVENGQITYTFTIQNTGNTAAVVADNVVVTDTFNPILTLTSVVYEGNNWVSPTNYTYDITTGLFQTVSGQIVVPAATFTQDISTGSWTITPGSVTLKVTGTV